MVHSQGGIYHFWSGIYHDATFQMVGPARRRRPRPARGVEWVRFGAANGPGPGQVTSAHGSGHWESEGAWDGRARPGDSILSRRVGRRGRRPP